MLRNINLLARSWWGPGIGAGGGRGEFGGRGQGRLACCFVSGHDLSGEVAEAGFSVLASAGGCGCNF
jgi:hypothetical protein